MNATVIAFISATGRRWNGLPLPANHQPKRCYLCGGHARVVGVVEPSYPFVRSGKPVQFFAYGLCAVHAPSDEIREVVDAKLRADFGATQGQPS